MKLYRKYLSIHVKSTFQYRTSFLFDIISSALITISSLFGILLLFQRFDTVGGYTKDVILITYSMIHCGFASAEMMFRGFDQFDHLVRTGELDRLLIRPRSIFLQVLGYKIEFNKLGRVVFGFGLLIYSLISSSIVWTAMRVITVILMYIGSIVIFAGMFLIYSGVSIFTVEGLEVMNVITNGGKHLCEYPIDVYSGVFRKFFTYILPLACINYIPLQYLLGYESATLFNALSPLISFAFFALCYLFFRWAITKYKSTGS